MDSVTQLVLGATVSEAVMGNRIGRKAALWGAVLGTLPDLDVLVPLGHGVAAFTYHRSFSHSLIVLAALTPIVVWLAKKIHPQYAGHHRRWYAAVFLVFATHVLLDSFTIYGTQIFWPIPVPPMTWGSIFIIDPAYTLPLLFGLLTVLIRRTPKAFQVNLLALTLSTLYLAWGFGAKLYVQDLAKDSLAQKGIAHTTLFAQPGPFNTVLWRVLVQGEDSYYEGFYSFLDSDRVIEFTQYPNGKALLEDVKDHWPVKRLAWFSKGYFKVTRDGSDVLMTDLRMGLEPDYIFNFKIGEFNGTKVIAAPDRLFEQRNFANRIPEVWERLKGD